MYTVAFQANVKDGTIEIPEAYRDRVHGDVRVIVLTQHTPPTRDMIQYLLENPLIAPDFRPMKRDEIYQGRVK